MTTEWTSWDAADDIESEEDAIAFLNAVLELNDPSLVPSALGAIARSRGMAQIAADTGLGRESLYKALSKTGNPKFSTIVKVLGSMGLSLQVTPKKDVVMLQSI